jgi:hypothetical protein
MALTLTDVITEPTGRFCGAKFWACAMDAMKIAATKNNLCLIEIFIPVDLPDGQFCSIVMEISKRISPYQARTK